MNKFDANYKLLDDLYFNEHYPVYFIDKLKSELLKIITLLESGEKNVEVIQEKFDEITCAINDVEEELEANDNMIDTFARECIGGDIIYILEWFDIPIDVEEAIRERDW